MDYLKELPERAKTSRVSKDGESGSSLNRFLELPDDVTANILHRLGAYEILKNAQRVCSSWRNICKNPSMWRVIDMKSLREHEYRDAMCRHAVSLGQGKLIKFEIDFFASDRLLAYISERSSHMRCLQIRGCPGVSDDGLIEAVKRFPLLEELHLVYVTNVGACIERIAQSCPKLKSFTLISPFKPNPSAYGYSYYYHHHYYHNVTEEQYDARGYNLQAQAIAKSMPGLSHLRLAGNSMSNKGMLAILDRCPNLELLDIRRCFNVDLRTGIRDRIARNIKDFKLPDDPIECGDWDARIRTALYSVSASDDPTDKFDSFLRR